MTKPTTFTRALCRSCLLREMRVAANAISTGVWLQATLTGCAPTSCSSCHKPKAKHQLTLTT